MSLNFNLKIETNFNSIEILYFLSKMNDFDFKWEENFLFGSEVVYATQENDVS